jgi:hypothetical protein
MKTITIILDVRSGIVYPVNIPKNINVEIRDYDILDCEPSELKKDSSGKSYYPIYF